MTNSIQPKRGRPPKTRPDEIISVARTLFSQQGYEQTSTQDIANILKICKASIYQYFLDKEQLLLFVVEQICKDLVFAFLEAAQEDGVRTHGQRLETLQKAIEAVICRDFRRREAILVFESLNKSKKIKIIIQQYMRIFQDLVAGLLMHRLPPYSASEKARDYVAAFMGAIFMVELGEDAKPFYRIYTRLQYELAC